MDDHVYRPSFSRGSSDSSSFENASFASSEASRQSSQSGRTLLFGEIPSPVDEKSNCSTSSVCNLVLSSNPTFLRLWLTESCRNAFLKNVDRQTLPALRQVCHNFASTAAPYLFKEITVDFKANTFARSSGRTAILKRIGRHVKKLTFKVPHSAESFLPPLLDPFTGQQMSFHYEPQLDSPTVRAPRYGTAEMTDLLIRQYPPVFHSATNVHAFIRAFSMMPNLEHVTVNSPDQNMTTKYRRSVADYVLISLRIALERAPLPELKSLALQQIHPCALLHLQPIMSFGSSPNSCRRWTQIKNLEITMDSTPFSLSKADELLRVVQNYLRAFSGTLISLKFAWTGLNKGPSPLSPEGESPISTPTASEPHLQAHPYFQHQMPKPFWFPCLKTISLSRATAHADHLGTFVTSHRFTLQDARFDDVTLRTGTWKSALVDPLKRVKAAELAEMSTQQMEQTSYDQAGTRVTVYDEEGAMAMDVPICMLFDSSNNLQTDEDDLVIEGELEPQMARKRGLVQGLKRLFGKGEREWEPPVRLDDNVPYVMRERRKKGVFGGIWKRR